jgi:carbonic anhydrase
MTSKVLGEVLDANGKYAASFGNKGDLALPPARRFAILTCMDARLDPAKYAGLSEGDAHVIRNAGGRASDDAIRSLVISHKLLGTLEWFVIHHTNCGMELFSDEIMGDLLEGSLATASFDGKNWSNPQHVATFTSPGGGKVVEPEPSGGCSGGHFVKWLTIKRQEESVAQDVRRIREHPLVPAYIPIYGYVYDVKTGHLVEVPEATTAGRAA